METKVRIETQVRLSRKNDLFPHNFTLEAHQAPTIKLSFAKQLLA